MMRYQWWGRRLWNKGDQRLKEIFGTKKDFWWPACNSSRGFSIKWHLLEIVMYSKMMTEGMDLLQQICGQTICKCTH